jgi:Zn finger protein HypA/HybF involved in hydrogenase expression
LITTIPRFKTGLCATCGAKGDVVKVKKETYCLSCNKNIKAHQQIERAKERNAVRGLPHIKGEDKRYIDSRNSLIQDLDYYFSRYIRILYSNEKGECKCYTCPTIKHFSLMQNGHFISRGHMGLRYEIKNQKVQCPYCNCNLHGNLEVYKQNLELEEKGLPERLLEQSREVEKPTTDELKQLLADVKIKLSILQKAKGIK